MTNKIGSHTPSSVSASQQALDGANKDDKPKRSFGKVLSGVADVALGVTAVVAPIVPGGQLIGMAARGISSMKQGRAGAAVATAPKDNIDQAWQMQQESQAFNMQYLQLQTQIQADNRNFSTLSNLMKARHDTAKSAINNMHA